MLMKLDAAWLIFALAGVAMLSYLFSIGLNALLRDDGFGVIGNALIIIAGFFGGIYLSNVYGIRFQALMPAIVHGLIGAFILLLVLVMAKLALNRLL